VGLGEGPTLLAGGVLCILGVSALMRWQPGFLRYDARNPTP
jgi:ENTS family enterobactin (siderophore) exporter